MTIIVLFPFCERVHTYRYVHVFLYRAKGWGWSVKPTIHILYCHVSYDVVFDYLYIAYITVVLSRSELGFVQDQICAHIKKKKKNNMKTRALSDAEKQRLRYRASRKQKKANRLLRKIEKELRRRKPNLPKILDLQRRTTKLLLQSTGYLERSLAATPDTTSVPHDQTNADHGLKFDIRKVSERHVRKYQASSCVYRASVVNDVRTDLKVSNCNAYFPCPLYFSIKSCTLCF